MNSNDYSNYVTDLIMINIDNDKNALEWVLDKITIGEIRSAEMLKEQFILLFETEEPEYYKINDGDGFSIRELEMMIDWRKLFKYYLDESRLQ